MMQDVAMKTVTKNKIIRRKLSYFQPDIPLKLCYFSTAFYDFGVNIQVIPLYLKRQTLHFIVNLTVC